MRERVVERRLVLRATQRGWLALKFTSPGRRGFPDRLLLGPHGEVCFVECKAPGGRLTPLQRHTHEILASYGRPVTVLDSVAAVDAWCGRLQPSSVSTSRD